MIRYFLLVNLYGGLLYLLYTALLKNRPRHTWSRCYLLLTCILSLTLPFIQPAFDILQKAAQPLRDAITLPELTIGKGGRMHAVGATGNWLPALYFAVVPVLLLRLAFRLFRLRRFLARLSFRQEGRYRIAVNTGLGPASFGHTIIFPEAEVDPLILRHEQAHAHRRHHYDKTGMALLQCICFPVLVFHLISRELDAVHEFEADADAATQPDQYAATLLRAHLGAERLPYLQSFAQPPLKRRIIMLRKEKKQDNDRHAILLVLTGILATAAIVLQSKGTAVADPGRSARQLPVAVRTGSEPEQQRDVAPVNPETTDPGDQLAAAGETGAATSLQEQQNMQAATGRENGPALPEHAAGQEATAGLQQGTQAKDDSKVYTNVDELPVFPGGMDALQQYLAENLRYPEAARKAGVEGKIYAQFVITETGSVTNISILRDIHPECSAEVVRVLQSMPAWQPGMLKDGTKVKVYYTLPVNFRLDKKK